MVLKAILFDVDGTLAETEMAHLAAFNRAFAAAGLPWEWSRKDYAELLSVTGGRERIEYFVESRGVPVPQGFDAAALHKHKTRIYNEGFGELGVPLRPGIERLINEARDAGVAIAVATTTSRPNVDSLLASTLGQDSIGWFATMACGEDVKAKKPSAEVYEVCLERLGIRPHEAIALEDSRNGLISALAAGIPTLITPSSFTQGQDFSGALSVLSNLGEPGAPFNWLAGERIDGPTLDLADLQGLANRQDLPDQQEQSHGQEQFHGKEQSESAPAPGQ